jgi:hypothetical protein
MAFRISSSQLAELRVCQLERSRWRVVSYLRKTAPDLTGQHDDASLYALIRDYETSGRTLGLKSEQAHAKWAYLMLTTSGEFDAPPVRAALADPDQVSADLALDQIMTAMVELEASNPERDG